MLLNFWKIRIIHSAEKIKDAILSIITTPKAMVEDDKILQLFVKLTSNEKNIEEFLDIFKKIIKPGDPTTDTARACVLLSNLALFIGHGDEKEDILKIIDSVAKGYSTNYQSCEPSKGQSFYIASSRGKGNRGTPGGIGTGAQRGPYVPPGGPGAFGTPP